MMNSILYSVRIQESWSTANITLIPKEGEDLTIKKDY